MSDLRLRLDKWLWYTRLCKTRSQAAALCDTGLLRHNGQEVRKPAQLVKIGDVLTVPRGRVLMTVEVLGLGIRRGPYAEASTLYREPDPADRPPIADPAWDRLLADQDDFS
jgi:ribosome-associated heat shock protein Hsp15